MQLRVQCLMLTVPIDAVILDSSKEIIRDSFGTSFMASNTNALICLILDVNMHCFLIISLTNVTNQ